MFGFLKNGHFKDVEFDCNDGTKYPEKFKKERLIPLKKSLELIRKEIGNKPIIINSGYRTESYNKKIGGAPRSMHKEGVAVDIFVKDINSDELANVIERMILDKRILEGGIGRYKSFVHYDIRSILGKRKARW